MELLIEFFERSNTNMDYFNFYIKHLSKLLATLDSKPLDDVIRCFLQARKNDGLIFFAGNGGSAATASHFAQDLAEVGRKLKVKGFRTMSLTDNVSLLTAVSNDYGYDKVFSIQMTDLFNKGDVLVVISASGNSRNVIEAARCARELGGSTIGLIGFDGGELSKICDHVIHIKTCKGDYGPVEDIHIILDHMITSLLMFKLMNGEPLNEV